MNNIFYVIYSHLNQASYFAIMAFVFIAVFSLVITATFLILKRDYLKKRITKLMKGAEGSEAEREKPKLIQENSSGLIARVANPLHSLAAPSKETVQKIHRLKLIRAGYRSKQAYRNFWAAKVFLALLLPVIYLTRCFFITFDAQMGLYFILLGGAGFMIPNVFLLQSVQKRQQRIQRALPDALDMMVVCVEAGLGLDMTFKKVGEEIKPLNQDLSEELFLTTLEVRAGKSRDESLRNLALRTGVPGIQNLVTLLVQTNRFGTSIGKALRVHADSLRGKRKQLAETKAAKSVVALLFPLIFFIFPAFFVVVLGPAIIRVSRNLLPVLGGH
jgi:tight adherence protein C